METAQIVLLLMRPVERLLAVGIGGLCIWLGYRLFLALPHETDSHGRVMLPGGVDVRLSRIGPGAFFALFGALVVGLALYRSVALDVPVQAMLPGAGTTVALAPSGTPATVSYNGMGPATAGRPDPGADPAALAGLRGTLADLNALTPTALRAGLSEPAATDVQLALPRAKLALMRNAWQAQWGDAAVFAAWVTAGAADPVPAGLEHAAALFRQGTPAGTAP